MGAILKYIVALSYVGFIYALFFGKGKFFRKFIFRLALPVVVVSSVISFWRGSWVPNAGGGLAVKYNPLRDIAFEDHPVDIPIGMGAGGDSFEGMEMETFDHPLEYYIADTPSQEYNPELSHMLMSLCISVHQRECIGQAFDSLGFPNGNQDRVLDYSMEDVLLAYGMGKKQLADGTNIILLAARGTGNENNWEDVSNFNIVVNHYGRHSGFSEAADKLHKRLIDFSEKDANLSDAIFVLTGHSRGVAAVNILAAMLADEGIMQERIYCYSFGCPDTAFLSDDAAESYGCIFNIGNVNDIVSWTPWNFWKSSGASLGLGGDSHWNKYGNSLWYSESDWKGELDASLSNFESEHGQGSYLRFLREEKGAGEYKNRYEASMLIDEK